MSTLKLEHVYKIYPNGTEAVKDFNLEINDGDFVILVGPSGCGKSTTLRMIAGLEDISKGSLYIDSKLSNQLSPKERDIAMVFQNYALYPHMTVYENMAFSLILRKENSDLIHKKVMAAAEILNLTDQLNKKPRALSGGQRQRVAIGRAIVRNPKVFLFDEPLSNLDAKLRNSMRRELLLLHKKLNATMIYVTHDQIEALTLADRIVCMSDAHVQQIGTPIELYDHPANLFVANFIGLPPMNIFNGIYSNHQITADKFTFNISDHQAKILSKYEGKEIVIGIRPEDIKMNGDIPLSVTINENLGKDTLVHGYIGNKKFVAKFHEWASYKQNDQINVAFDESKMHFFDKETTQAIEEAKL